VLKDDKSREQVMILDLLNLISLLGKKWENTNKKDSMRLTRASAQRPKSSDFRVFLEPK
jgi:hypothetical protein